MDEEQGGEEDEEQGGEVDEEQGGEVDEEQGGEVDEEQGECLCVFGVHVCLGAGMGAMQSCVVI